MKEFDYRKLEKLTLSYDLLNMLTKIHEYKGKQELYIAAKPEILGKLTDLALIQSTESSNKIEGISTTNGRLREIMEEKSTPRNRDEEEIAEVVNEEASEEIDVNDGWDASEALAQETQEAAAAFHKLGDGYETEDEAKEKFEDCFVLIEKDGTYKAFEYPTWDDIKDEAENADAVYYRDMNDIITSDETEDIIMDNSQWGCEDYSLDNAIVDVLSGTNEYEWPAINIDFIYNGKVFYSFTL